MNTNTVFTKNIPTNHALTDITEKIRSALDQNIFACGIFIDLQKAFNTVNHDIHLHKLDHYGIRHLPNKWFQSFLSERSQTRRGVRKCNSAFFGMYEGLEEMHS